MDIVDKLIRSRIMSSVRQKHTRPEKLLRSVLHKSGLRFRLHDNGLPGSPDLVFPRFGAVVFVHGCYWHSHGCYRSTVPKTRREFWEEKFRANRRRDTKNIERLLLRGWRVMVVWECAIVGKHALAPDDVSGIVSTWLRSARPNCELPENISSAVAKSAQS